MSFLETLSKLLLSLIQKSPEVEVSIPIAEPPAAVEPIYFKISELNSHNYATTPEIDANLNILIQRVTKIRIAWGKPMTVTSGLRSAADQERINPKAPKSNHLLGAAVDIYDPELLLTAWLKENDSQTLVDNELWCEEGNKNWVHFQIFPPHSGNRWFLP